MFLNRKLFFSKNISKMYLIIINSIESVILNRLKLSKVNFSYLSTYNTVIVTQYLFI